MFIARENPIGYSSVGREMSPRGGAETYLKGPAVL